MKTKTKPQSKILIVLAAILCCIFSLNSFAQNPIVPTFQDFMGTWTGATDNGRPVEITLTSEGMCNFNTANNIPMFPDNPVVAYRMPQFFPKTIADNGPPTNPEILIKFYTQNAIAGIRVPVSASTSTSAAGDNSVTTGTVEQIYTGIAVISLPAVAGGQNEMRIYIDVNNFSAVPPVLIPAPDEIPYCVLVKQ